MLNREGFRRVLGRKEASRETRTRRVSVPQLDGTGEISVPHVGLVRPFSFFCGKFEFALGARERRAGFVR
jgi:hypothetical protein